MTRLALTQRARNPEPQLLESFLGLGLWCFRADASEQLTRAFSFLFNRSLF